MGVYNKIILLFILYSTQFLLIPTIVYSFDYVICHDNDDCIDYGIPTNPQPAVGESYIDPFLGTNITRVTDVSLSGLDKEYIQYSRYTPENSDGTLLIGAQKRIYNLTDMSYVGLAPYPYKYFFDSGLCGGDIEYRWDYTGNHPTRLYFRYGSKFYSGDAITRELELIRDFNDDFPEEICMIHNDDEGDSSSDSRYWTFMAHGPYDYYGRDVKSKPLYYIFVFDKDYDIYNTDDDGKTGKIIGVLDRKLMEEWGNIDFTGLLDIQIHKPNFVDIAPSGNRILCSWDWHEGGEGSTIDGPRSYNLDFSDPIQVGYSSLHSGWAFNENGEELFVEARDKNSATNIYTGESISFNYVPETLGGWSRHMHFSRIYLHDKPGWALMSTYENDEKRRWSDAQLLMVELRPREEYPRIWRIAHTQSSGASPRGALSYDGNRIFWASDWRGEDDNKEIYMVTLPEDWYEDLSGPLETCTNLSGDCCSIGESCSGGTFQLSSDCGSLCCVGGICSPKSTCNSGADKDDSGEVSMDELVVFIGDWITGRITIAQVLEAIGEWKSGC